MRLYPAHRRLAAPPGLEAVGEPCRLVEDDSGAQPGQVRAAGFDRAPLPTARRGCVLNRRWPETQRRRDEGARQVTVLRMRRPERREEERGRIVASDRQAEAAGSPAVALLERLPRPELLEVLASESRDVAVDLAVWAVAARAASAVPR
jgi:hypothetical protein